MIFVSFFLLFVCMCVFKMYFLLLLFQRQHYRERDREKSAIHWFTPNCHNGQGWARRKPGAWNSIWSLQRGPRTWTIFHCFLRHISSELDWKWNRQQFNPLCHYVWHLNTGLWPLIVLTLLLNSLFGGAIKPLLIM